MPLTRVQLSIAVADSPITPGRLANRSRAQSRIPGAGARAAVAVEDRYSRIFSLEHVPGRVIADGLAELQVRWPAVPIVFMETRKLAEESTYRYLCRRVRVGE